MDPHHLYTVIIPPPVQKQIKKLPSDIRPKILTRLRHLQNAPRPAGVEKLSGYKDYYRIRVGEYRIIYTIEDKKLLILVVRVGTRNQIYKDLKKM